jgi:hypothetical protein
VVDISILTLNGYRYVQKCERLICEKNNYYVEWLNFCVKYCQTTRRNVSLKQLQQSDTPTEIPPVVTPKRESSDDDAETIGLRELEKTPQFQDK